MLTAYVRERIRDINARGNNATASRRGTIRTTVMHRKILTISTVIRRPPGTRSITGPMNGAITANGARLIARNNRTLLRAASGLIDRKSESASAMANAASPQAVSACTRPSLLKGDAGVSPELEIAMRLFSRICSPTRGWSQPDTDRMVFLQFLHEVALRGHPKFLYHQNNQPPKRDQ